MNTRHFYDNYLRALRAGACGHFRRIEEGGYRPCPFDGDDRYRKRCQNGNHGNHSPVQRNCAVPVRYVADGRRTQKSCRKPAGADPVPPVQYAPEGRAARYRRHRRDPVLQRDLDHGGRLCERGHDEAAAGHRHHPRRHPGHQRHRLGHQPELSRHRLRHRQAALHRDPDRHCRCGRHPSADVLQKDGQKARRRYSAGLRGADVRHEYHERRGFRPGKAGMVRRHIAEALQSAARHPGGRGLHGAAAVGVRGGRHRAGAVRHRSDALRGGAAAADGHRHRRCLPGAAFGARRQDRRQAHGAGLSGFGGRGRRIPSPWRS